MIGVGKETPEKQLVPAESTAELLGEKKTQLSISILAGSSSVLAREVLLDPYYRCADRVTEG